MVRLLVTGATGFIGRRLMATLGTRLEIHATHRGVVSAPSAAAYWHQVDLSERSEVLALFENVNPTHVLHLAVTRERGPEGTAREMAMSRALCDAIAMVPPLVWVHAGSQYEYAPGPLPYHENAPVGPVHEFGERKLSTLRSIRKAVDEHGGEFRHLRIFSVFGPFEAPTRFIPATISRAYRGEPIPTTHEQVVHDFVYVDDVVRALRLALERSFDGPINVGSGRGLSNVEVCRIIVAALGSTSRVDVGAYPSKDRDLNPCVAALRKANDVLRWKPESSFVDGVLRTHRFMSEHPELYEL